ncbi:hypothetical protein DL240_01325 [Lujinxingia litoralis]|uniref:HEAT repeat domain-containing protein n=1 Tax=Lujinxingia litoralis TaxID=2211119 RepID=A0A328CAA0_9DELT|nr:HEAT repeat domain-containing protein [Lujinxingia litoralis]RAL24878.1 hypothetical protein DL240_01325 [Lujinxingia litoralis]
MKLWLLTLALLSLIASPAMAENGDRRVSTPSSDTPGDVRPSQGDAHIEEAVLMLLSQHHQVPTRKQLETLTPRAKEIVGRLARTEGLFAFHRERALLAMGHWPDDATFAYFQSLLQAPDTEEGLVHTLISVLASSYGERALDVLSPLLLGHDDVQVRLSAGAAIGSLNSDAGAKLLDVAIDQEPNAIARQRLEGFAARLR